MLASTAAPQKHVGSRGRASGGGEDLPGKDGAAVAIGAPRLSGPWDGALSGACDRTRRGGVKDRKWTGATMGLCGIRDGGRR